MIKYIRFAAAPTLTAFGAFFALKGEHWMWVYFAIFALINAKIQKKAVRLKDNQFNSTGIKERLINLTESHEGSLDK